MANYTYSFDGGDQGSLSTVIGRYNAEFRTAVRDAIGSLIPDSDGDANDYNINFQFMDQDGVEFDTAGYGGAYLAEGDDFANLDEAPVLLFDDAVSDGDGISVRLSGDTEQFVGMTSYGDKLVIKADSADEGVVVDAYKGNDTVTTGKGDDIVYGGDGDDRDVHGDSGHERGQRGAAEHRGQPVVEHR